MKSTALVACLALVLLSAASAMAGEGDSFGLSGSIVKAHCAESPTLTGPGLLQCELAVTPDLGFAKEVSLFCLDPEVARLCASFDVGSAVVVVGVEQRGLKVVKKIASNG